MSSAQQQQAHHPTVKGSASRRAHAMHSLTLVLCSPSPAGLCLGSGFSLASRLSLARSLLLSPFSFRRQHILASAGSPNKQGQGTRLTTPSRTLTVRSRRPTRRDHMLEAPSAQRPSPPCRPRPSLACATRRHASRVTLQVHRSMQRQARTPRACLHVTPTQKETCKVRHTHTSLSLHTGGWGCPLLLFPSPLSPLSRQRSSPSERARERTRESERGRENEKAGTAWA